MILIDFRVETGVFGDLEEVIARNENMYVLDGICDIPDVIGQCRVAKLQEATAFQESGRGGNRISQAFFRADQGLGDILSIGNIAQVGYTY
jgi:hypothetical protein